MSTPCLIICTPFSHLIPDIDLSSDKCVKKTKILYLTEHFSYTFLAQTVFPFSSMSERFINSFTAPYRSN